ncbi:MAG: hypothetical protein RLZZ165_1362 [Bacteroidota bacterium]
MDPSTLSGTFLAALLLIGHLVAASVIALGAYAVMKVARLMPDIRYLFWATFIGGSLAWGYTAYKLLSYSVPFKWWADKALMWYALLAMGGLVVGVLIQRSKL